MQKYQVVAIIDVVVYTYTIYYWVLVDNIKYLFLVVWLCVPSFPMSDYLLFFLIVYFCYVMSVLVRIIEYFFIIFFFGVLFFYPLIQLLTPKSTLNPYIRSSKSRQIGYKTTKKTNLSTFHLFLGYKNQLFWSLFWLVFKVINYAYFLDFSWFCKFSNVICNM